MREHCALSFRFGIVVPIVLAFFVFSLSLPAPVTTEGGPVPVSPLASSSGGGVSVTTTASTLNKLSKNSSSISLHGFFHFFCWWVVPPSRVVPVRWSDLLLSDRDGRNDIFGTARDGLFSCLVSASGCLLVATSRNIPSLRTIVQETVLKANLKLLNVNPRVFCGTDDSIRSLDLQVVIGLSYVFSGGESTFGPSFSKKRHCRHCRSCPSTFEYRFRAGCSHFFDR